MALPTPPTSERTCFREIFKIFNDSKDFSLRRGLEVLVSVFSLDRDVGSVKFAHFYSPIAAFRPTNLYLANLYLASQGKLKKEALRVLKLTENALADIG